MGESAGREQISPCRGFAFLVTNVYEAENTMKAIINGYYEIEIVESTYDQDMLSLRVSYSRSDYPDFHTFIGNTVMEKKPVTYWENQQESMLLIIGCSFCMSVDMLDDSVRNEDIILDEYTYGKIISTVPVEKRREFVFNQAYGRIDAKYMDATLD